MIHDLRIFFIFSQKNKPILLSEIFTKHSLWHEEKSVETRKNVISFCLKNKTCRQICNFGIRDTCFWTYASDTYVIYENNHDLGSTTIVTYYTAA